MLSARKSAPLLAAALLALDAGGAWAQGPVVRLPEQDRALAGTAPQVFAIGRAEGADHEMFGEIAGVVFDAQENLYVLDRQSNRIIVYDRNGRFLRQISKRGQGPGELISPLQLVMGGDGTLIVSDPGRFGYSIFRTDGTFVRNVRVESVLFSPRGIAWHPRNGVIGAFMQRPGDRPGTQISTAEPLMFVPLGGGEPTRVFTLPSRDQVTQNSTPAGEGGVNVRMTRRPPPAFSPVTMFDVLPDGNVALSFTSGYTVRIVDLNGQTLRYLQRPMRPRLTTDRDREQARVARREQMASGRGQIRISMGGPAGGGGGGRGEPGRGNPDPAQMERMMGEMEFADTIPALQGLRVTPSGKLWIERTGQNVGDPGPVDVVTPQGQYLGTVTGIGLPDAFSRGGLAAFIEYDDDGVGKVVVRRLPANWR